MSSTGNRNGTQVTKARQEKKPQQKVEQKPKPKPVNRNSKKGPVRIGDNTDPDKWRCKTCKYLNDVESI